MSNPVGTENVFNHLMSHSIQCSEKEDHLSRIASTLTTVPVELATSLQNLIFLPFKVVGMVAHGPLLITKNIVKFTVSQKSHDKIHEYDKDLPGLKSCAMTAYKVVGFILGACSTLTIGLVNTKLNTTIHEKLALLNQTDFYQAAVNEGEAITKYPSCKEYNENFKNVLAEIDDKYNKLTEFTNKLEAERNDLIKKIEEVTRGIPEVTEEMKQDQQKNEQLNK